LCGQDGGQDGGSDDAVEPEMIGGDDDGERGHDRVRHGEPAPPAPERGDDRGRHEDGPADVHGRHRGQLVRVQAGRVGVNRLVVHDGRVDHPGAREHAGRRDRHQLDEQADTGEGHQRRAPAAVVGPVPDEQPDHAGDQNREVQDVVIQVEELDQQGMRQEQPLQPGLARHADGPLELPDPACPADRSIRSKDGESAGILPERVQADDEAGFKRSRSDLGKQPSTGRPKCQRGNRQPGSRPGCLLPIQGEVDHSGCRALHVTRSDYGLVANS